MAVLVNLTVVLVLAGSRGTLPYAGQEISWRVALNAARPEGLVYGRDILYTYGPWGFLDHPLTLSYPQYVAGLLFGIGALIVFWMPLYLALRRSYPPHVAAIVATVATVSCARVSETSSFLVTGMAACAIVWLGTPRPSTRRFHVNTVAVAAGAAAGLILQVKLSGGVGAVAVALVVAAAAPTWKSAILDVVATITAVVVSFLGFWTLAGQPIDVIPAWVRGAIEIVIGYSEAMGIERDDWLMGYLAAGLLAGTLAWWATYRVRVLPAIDRIAIAVLTFTILDLSFKAAFSRHDNHEFAFFVTTTALVIVIGVLAARRRAMVAALVLSLFMSTQGLALLDVGGLRDQWRLTVQNMLIPASAASTTEQSRVDGVATYALPQEFLDRIGSHPIGIDPSEAALAVAYELNWNPVPVFQAHVAYTSYLDHLNADAAREAPSDQVMLRLPDRTIDGRNVRWETPQYLLTLACDYTQVLSDDRWSLMVHDTPRCGERQPLEPQHLDADEVIAVPDGDPDTIVVASFEPDPEGIVTRLSHAALKDWSGFVVTADDKPYMLPERLASGPLLVDYPGRGKRGLYPAFRYEKVSFSMPGTVTFATIDFDR